MSNCKYSKFKFFHFHHLTISFAMFQSRRQNSILQSSVGARITLITSDLRPSQSIKPPDSKSIPSTSANSTKSTHSNSILRPSPRANLPSALPTSRQSSTKYSALPHPTRPALVQSRPALLRPRPSLPILSVSARGVPRPSEPSLPRLPLIPTYVPPPTHSSAPHHQLSFSLPRSATPVQPLRIKKAQASIPLNTLDQPLRRSLSTGSHDSLFTQTTSCSSPTPLTSSDEGFNKWDPGLHIPRSESPAHPIHSQASSTVQSTPFRPRKASVPRPSHITVLLRIRRPIKLPTPGQHSCLLLVRLSRSFSHMQLC